MNHDRNQTSILQVEFHTRRCQLSSRDRKRIDSDLDQLRELISGLSSADLDIDVRKNPKNNDYQVKTTLRLPQGTLFTGERDGGLDAAWKRCFRKLIQKVESEEGLLDDLPDVLPVAVGPSAGPDPVAAHMAFVEGRFSAFRDALLVCEASLEKRIGRGIDRDKRATRMLGDAFSLRDVIDGVYLTAFDRFEERRGADLGEWLEGLVEESITALVNDPEGELENIERVRGE